MHWHRSAGYLLQRLVTGKWSRDFNHFNSIVNPVGHIHPLLQYLPELIIFVEP